MSDGRRLQAAAPGRSEAAAPGRSDAPARQFGRTAAARARGRLSGLAAAVVAGAAMAVQYRINGALGRAVGDSAAASAVSFVLGLAVLGCIVAAAPGPRRGVVVLCRAAAAGAPRWYGLGGAFGAFLVTAQCLVAARLGVAMFTVAVVAGQTVGGLLLDATRLAPGGSRPVTRARLASAVLVLAAVSALFAGSTVAWTGLAAALLPMLAGMGVAGQYALNGRLRGLCGHALAAAFGNFLVGTTALAVVLAVDVAVREPPGRWPDQPWLYLGGPLGVLYVALIAAAVSSIGTFVLGLTVVLGQIVAAAALAYGEGGLPPGAGAATALAVIAVAVAGSGRMRFTRPVRRRPAATSMTQHGTRQI